MRFLFALPLVASLVLAQEAPFSGPQPGEALAPFRVLMINGPEAGREVDVISQFGDSPVLLLFLHQIDRNVGAMVRPCEEYAQERAAAGLKTLIVFLSADKVEGERRMQAVTRSLRLQSPVGVSVDGVEGPGAYGLNKQIAVTAIVAKDRKVTANFALVQPGMVDSTRVLTEVAKHVGGHVKTREELEDYQKSAMSRQGGMMQPKPADPPEMVNLLRALIQKTNSNAQVDSTVQGMREWAGQDASRKAALAAKLGVIIPLKYGTEYAQSQMPLLKAELER